MKLTKKEGGQDMIDTVRNWYEEQNKAVKIILQIVITAVILAAFYVFVRPVVYEAGRALGRWSVENLR